MNIKNNGEYKGQGYNMFQSSQWTVILNKNTPHCQSGCLLYTSDAADEPCGV